MKDLKNMHQEIQQQADCYASNDPLREMSAIESERDKEQIAPKWLALAALHGVNANAKKITLRKTADGGVEVVAKYRKSGLPAPGAETAERIFAAAREVGHFDGDKGKLPLSLGIRDSSVDVVLKVSRGDKGEELVLKFK